MGIAVLQVVYYFKDSMTRSKGTPSRVELERLYANGVNIMAHLRQERGVETNDLDIIKASYDVQAGSYVAALTDTERVALNGRIGQRFADVFDRLRPTTLLEAGTGELTTLAAAVPHMTMRPKRLLAFDISTDRLAVGHRYWKSQRLPPVCLFTAALQSTPLPDASVDVVFTSHALEPNGGSELAILRELHRVARRYVVLREPSWELGSDETRARILEHRYVRGLPEASRCVGFTIVEHSLWGLDPNPANQAALLVLAK